MSENLETPRLKLIYEEEIRASLIKQFGYKNKMQTPVLDKIIINMGVGEGSADKKKIEAASREISMIAGQKSVVTKAKKSISTFKIREGMDVGCKVTLRRDRMYEFLDRLVTIALPRVRDFRGLSSKSFDGRGNYTMGLKEQIVFPEIDYDSVDQVRGMNIVICTTAETNDEGRALLTAFQLPIIN